MNNHNKGRSLCIDDKKNCPDRYLIFQTKILARGQWKQRVLIAAFKNETIAKITFKKMVSSGMKELELVPIKAAKGQPLNWGWNWG